MNKTPVLLATILLPVLGAALAAQSCSGESLGNGSGSGGGTSSTGSGGSSSTRGSGGATMAIGNSSGGSPATSSGGASVPGGGTGGSTVISGGTGGGSVIIGAGSGGAAVTGTGTLVAMNGFVTSGTWKGYASTFTSGTTTVITPVCDAAGTAACFQAAGAKLCAMGTVAADLSSASSAGLGFNVNQAMATSAVSPVKGSIAASGTGLALSVTGYIPGMRAQIQNAAGMRWCAALTTAVASIPWSMFNTMCYAVPQPAAGAFVTGTPIADVEIVIPSQTTLPVQFDFCLLDAHQY
jgi:hypothetical protein